MKTVLIVGAECAPFAKTGGLADVIGTLPKELVALGIDARVIMPLHKVVKDKYGDKLEHIADFYIQLGWRTQYVGIEKLQHNGVTYYFVDNEFYFGNKIYMGGEFEGEQYFYFTRAVLDSLEHIGFIPDVIHCNDWHTGMIPMLLRTQYSETRLGVIKTVFTIHNIMYQGQLPFGLISEMLGVDSKFYNSRCLEAYGSANVLKAALVFADKINTVSPTYANEIQFPYYGYGMDGLLNSRAADLEGILNGIDVDEWNPQKDEFIDFAFSAKDLSGKARNKEKLLEELGMDTSDPNRPLIGVVSRLTQQKGFDLVMHMMGEIMDTDCSVVLLGSGDSIYEDFFREMEQTFKGRFCAWIGYDNALSHKIYAASDLFLMPSKFEPCGISQMIALAYGSLPVVRETGGLKDTVAPYNAFTGEGNGFSFTNYNAHDMMSVINYAVDVARDPEQHEKLMKQAMEVDNSFVASAKKYKKLYQRAMK